MSKMRALTTSSRTKGTGAQAVLIPADLAVGLPDYCVWEIAVVDDGYRLSFVGEREKGERAKAEKVRFLSQGDD